MYLVDKSRIALDLVDSKKEISKWPSTIYVISSNMASIATVKMLIVFGATGNVKVILNYYSFRKCQLELNMTSSMAKQR